MSKFYTSCGGPIYRLSFGRTNVPARPPAGGMDAPIPF